jgi:hypothetical protein
MASRKKPPPSVPQTVEPEAQPLEYATTPEEASPEAAVMSDSAPDRETHIRQGAYAAFERRGGQGGNPAQDWLDAEAEWERQQNS